MTLDEAIKMCNRISHEALYGIEDSMALHDNDSIEKFRVIRENHLQLAEWLRELKELKERREADVQPVDIKEILRHLDSLMLCIGNAYNTSHYLLEGDMEFIEKQEKIIKELCGADMRGGANGT